MTTFDTIANAYIAAWNARDADRAQAVAAAFAPDATYTDPLADVSGRAAIAELIGGAQQQFAGWTFRLAGPVDATTTRPASPGRSARRTVRRPSSPSTSSHSTTTG